MASDPLAYQMEVREEVRSWIDYSAKLMRRRGAAADGDLFTVLPTEAGSPLAGRPALMPQGRASSTPSVLI